MKIKVILLLLGGMLIGCTSTQKTIVPTAKSEALNALIAQKSFRINSDWAYPLATASLNSIANSGLLPPGSMANSINLIGNQNYVRVYGDSIAMSLPFYGEQQLPGRYNSNEGGISFKGIPDRLEITKDEKRQKHILKFTAKNKRESYNVIVTLFHNWNSNITVNSSHRTSISYRGKVTELESDKGVVVK